MIQLIGHDSSDVGLVLAGEDFLRTVYGICELVIYSKRQGLDF